MALGNCYELRRLYEASHLSTPDTILSTVSGVAPDALALVLAIVASVASSSPHWFRAHKYS